MSKKIKILSCLLVVLTLFLVNPLMSIASDTGVEQWEQLSTTDKFKEWNIEFNHQLDPNTINHKNILLTDEYGTFYMNPIIDLVLENNNRTLILKSNVEFGYDINKIYYIHLKRDIKSIDSESLEKEVLIPFIVEANFSNSFTVSGISMGDNIDKLIDILGEPSRIDLSGKDYNWYIYNQDYYNYIQIGIKAGKVVSIYSAKENLLPDYGINLGMTREEIENIFVNEVKYEDGYTDGHKYIIGNNVITFYYDIYKNNELTGMWVEDSYYASLYPDITKETINSFEKQILDLANVARVQNDLKPYLWNEEAANTARKHSQDMADNNYTGHYDNTGKGPRERLEDDNVDFRNLAENVASGYPTAIEVHHGWMESPLGHRENILSLLKELGVGGALSSDRDYFGYRPYYTQLFITPSHYDFEDDEFVDDDYDFTISDEDREKSIIYDIQSESYGDRPGIVDVIGGKLIFYNDRFNFEIKLRDIPEQLTINKDNIGLYKLEYRWAVIVENDNTEYMFFCENIKLSDGEEVVPIEQLRDYLQGDIYMREKGQDYYSISNGILVFEFDINNKLLKLEGLSPFELVPSDITNIDIITIYN